MKKLFAPLKFFKNKKIVRFSFMNTHISNLWEKNYYENFLNYFVTYKKAELNTHELIRETVNNVP